MALEDRQQYGNDDAREENCGDQLPVANVFVRHVKSGQSGDEEANGDEEEEAFQRQGVVGRLWCFSRSRWRRGSFGELLYFGCGFFRCGLVGSLVRGRDFSDRNDRVCFLWIWASITAQAGGL